MSDRRKLIFKVSGFTALAILVVGYAAATAIYNIQKPTEKPKSEQTVSEEIAPSAIYNLVNEQRAKNSVAPLANNPKLTVAAEAKCADMVKDDYYDHTNPKTGKHGYEFAQETLDNDKYTSENLNQGVVKTNKELIDSWLNSPAHKAAMLDTQFTDTGVATCDVPSSDIGATTVVQFFANFYPPQPVTQQGTSNVRLHTTCSSIDIYGTGNPTTFCN